MRVQLRAYDRRGYIVGAGLILRVLWYVASAIFLIPGSILVRSLNVTCCACSVRGRFAYHQSATVSLRASI